MQAGTTVTNLQGTAVPVRPGSDMIEVRGVLQSPLLAFDDDNSNGCQGASNTCVGQVDVDVKAQTNLGHVNDDAGNRPQFAAIDAYTAGAASSPMMVLVTSNIDVHSGCSGIPTPQRYPQALYNVGVINAPTSLVTNQTFGNVDFAYSASGFRVIEYDNENPADSATASGYNFPSGIKNPLRGVGILDDFIFFIDNTDPQHPGLAQGIRRGAAFDVVRIADDVEDMQIAYGVDGWDSGNPPDGKVSRFSPPAPPDDPDAERVHVGRRRRVGAERAGRGGAHPGPVPAGPQRDLDDAAVRARRLAAPAAHCPTLHGVMISLVAKGRDPDPTYRGDGSRGFRVMNSPVTVQAPFPDTAIYPTPPPEPHYRRRIQTLKINLRNYAEPIWASHGQTSRGGR